jgi:hypothetical protein|tara:strand:- start:1008 stop:1475 length:468 start_codon:yes stop_codon:yes gene_type:complete
MDRLPIEIQDKIWNLYYKDIYKENIIHELKNNIYLFYSLHNEICGVKCSLFSRGYLKINKSIIIDLNNKIEKVLKNKVICLIYKSKNNFLGYLNQILRFSNAYSSLPIDCRLAGAYLYKLSNFNQKLLKRLVVVCSQEDAIFCNFYKNMCKSIKN